MVVVVAVQGWRWWRGDGSGGGVMVVVAVQGWRWWRGDGSGGGVMVVVQGC